MTTAQSRWVKPIPELNSLPTLRGQTDDFGTFFVKKMHETNIFWTKVALFLSREAPPFCLHLGVTLPSEKLMILERSLRERCTKQTHILDEVSSTVASRSAVIW